MAKDAQGKVFVVIGLGRMVYHGKTPHGWPLVKRTTDPAYFGTVVLQGERGTKLNADVAEFEGEDEQVAP